MAPTKPTKGVPERPRSSPPLTRSSSQVIQKEEQGKEEHTDLVQTIEALKELVEALQKELFAVKEQMQTEISDLKDQVTTYQIYNSGLTDQISEGLKPSPRHETNRQPLIRYTKLREFSELVPDRISIDRHTTHVEDVLRESGYTIKAVGISSFMFGFIECWKSSLSGGVLDSGPKWLTLWNQTSKEDDKAPDSKPYRSKEEFVEHLKDTMCRKNAQAEINAKLEKCCESFRRDLSSITFDGVFNFVQRYNTLVKLAGIGWQLPFRSLQDLLPHTDLWNQYSSLLISMRRMDRSTKLKDLPDSEESWDLAIEAILDILTELHNRATRENKPKLFLAKSAPVPIKIKPLLPTPSATIVSLDRKFDPFHLATAVNIPEGWLSPLLGDDYKIIEGKNVSAMSPETRKAWLQQHGRCAYCHRAHENGKCNTAGSFAFREAFPHWSPLSKVKIPKQLKE